MKAVGIAGIIALLCSVSVNGGMRALTECEVRAIARTEILAEGESEFFSYQKKRFGVIPYVVYRNASDVRQYIFTVSTTSIHPDGNDYEIETYFSPTNISYTYSADELCDGNEIYARGSEGFLLKRNGTDPALLFSQTVYRQLSNEIWQVTYNTKLINFNTNGLPYGMNLPDGGLSLFRSPDFISVEVCDPWILKGTNAVVEQAANIPPLTSRVIACSDKAGAAALYRACRSQTGTNVAGSVSAVFFDVNRDGDCDAYLTDETRATDEGKFEWSLALHGTNGWMMAEADFVSDVELATGEHLALTAGGRPYTSPKTLVAATNDFFAVSKWMWWHSDEYLEIGAPEIEVSNPRELNKLEKLPCEVIE